MKYSELPEDIRSVAEKIISIDAKYSATAGYYDRTHGDNVSRGKAIAKLNRLITKYNLNDMAVYGAIANKDFK